MGIYIDHISLSFKKNQLLKDSTFKAKRGEITTIIGESGIGKSSLLYGIAGYYPLRYQNYDYDNKKINYNEHQNYLHENMAFLFKESYLFTKKTVKENLDYFYELGSKKKSIEEILEKLHLNVKLSLSVDKLSRGQKIRLAFGCVLLRDSDVYILDEPLSYLDDKSQYYILDIIKELAYKENKIVIIASHNDKVRKISDVVYEIINGDLQIVRDNDQPEKKSRLKKLNKEIKNFMVRGSYAIYLPIMIAIVAILGFYLVRITQINQTKYLLNKLSSNNLFITNLSDNTIEELLDKDYIEEIIGFDEVKIDYYIQSDVGKFSKVKAVILPYHKDLGLENFSEQTLNNQSNNYVSSYLVPDYDDIDSLSLVIHNKEYQLDGLLKKQYFIDYHGNGIGVSDVIFVDKEIYNKLLEANHSFHRYLIHFNHYEKLEEILTYLNEVSSESMIASEYDTLENKIELIKSNEEQLAQTFQLISYIIFIFGIIYLLFMYLSRKIEYIIYLSNGMSKKRLIFNTLKENILLSMYSVLGIMSASLILSLFTTTYKLKETMVFLSLIQIGMYVVSFLIFSLVIIVTNIHRLLKSS